MFRAIECGVPASTDTVVRVRVYTLAVPWRKLGATTTAGAHAP